MAYTGSVPFFPEREAMKRATYEDVLNAPENKVAEILDGELVLSPRPAMRHSLAASTLGGVLSEPFGRGRGGPGGWWVLDEPELHFGEHVVVARPRRLATGAAALGPRCALARTRPRLGVRGAVAL